MYIPDGFGTVFPYIFASDAAAYLTFLERAFGAEVVGRTEAPDGTVANARVRIGRTAFMVSEAGGRFKPSRAAFYIYVEDADQTHREALACGADPTWRHPDQGPARGASALHAAAAHGALDACELLAQWLSGGGGGGGGGIGAPHGDDHHAGGEACSPLEVGSVRSGVGGSGPCGAGAPRLSRTIGCCLPRNHTRVRVVRVFTAAAAPLLPCDARGPRRRRRDAARRSDARGRARGRQAALQVARRRQFLIYHEATRS